MFSVVLHFEVLSTNLPKVLTLVRLQTKRNFVYPSLQQISLTMNSELVAAQALLDLQGDRQHYPLPYYNQWKQSVDEMENPTTISKVFNSLITSKAFKYYKHTHLPLSKKDTCDVGTQTDFKNRPSDIENLESMLKELHGAMESSGEETEPKLFARKAYKRRRSTTDTTRNESYDFNSSKRKYNSSDAGCQISKPDSSVTKPEENKSHKTCGEVVVAGEGNLRVPAKVMKRIDWSSYTSATRKLLSAVFPRHILATHSLTGKQSPAFPGKPAKKKLDAALVNDIVQVVMEKCNVPENIVRTSITTKCADESKMYRTRQLKKKKRKTLKKENVSPFHTSDDSDV